MHIAVSESQQRSTQCSWRINQCHSVHTLRHFPVAITDNVVTVFEESSRNDVSPDIFWNIIQESGIAVQELIDDNANGILLLFDSNQLPCQRIVLFQNLTVIISNHVVFMVTVRGHLDTRIEKGNCKMWIIGFRGNDLFILHLDGVSVSISLLSIPWIPQIPFSITSDLKWFYSVLLQFSLLLHLLTFRCSM